MADRRIDTFKAKMQDETVYGPYAERAVAAVYRLGFSTNQLIRRAVHWFAVLLHIVELVRAAMGGAAYDALGADATADRPSYATFAEFMATQRLGEQEQQLDTFLRLVTVSAMVQLLGTDAEKAAWETKEQASYEFEVLE